jgi:coatomer subunit beta
LNTSSSASVRYEAAATLVTLSQAPTALRAAANCFIDICIKESDNNVKLIVLDRLIALKDSASGAERVLQDSLMDILRILNVATDLEVKQKILNLGLDLVSSRNVEELVQLLKKEILKTQNESQGSNEETNKYRQLLVGTLHSICLKYPDVLNSNNLLSTMFELLTNQDDETTAILVIVFTREFIMKNVNQKNNIIGRILEVFPSIRNVKVHRGLIWILGEFCDENEFQIQEAMSVIKSSIGEIPIVGSELKKLEDGIEKEESVTVTSATPAKLVTADGSYATQSALSVSTKIEKTVNIPALRSYLLNGEFFIGTALANCLVKLALRFKQVVGVGKLTNAFLAESMIILTSILHLGKSKLINQTINEDDYERIALCLMILTNICSENGINADIQYLLNAIFLAEMRSSLDSMLSSNKSEQEEAKNELRAKKNKCVESDDHLSFSQLMSKNSETLENQFDVSLSQAIGGNVGPTATTALGQKGSNVADLLSASKLSKVTQLTGFSDPVYAECYVNVNQYDICLDVLIVNQSSDTLQNCTLELATLGDLKLVEKPQPLVLAPHDFANIKASVKVASTENGIIFGNIGKTFDNFTQYFMKDLLIEISYQLFILKFMTFPVRHQIEM